MKFAELSLFLKRLEDTPSRIEITKILADLLKKAEVGEVDKICYLVLGTLAPSYKAIVFDIAEKMMLRVISLAYDAKAEEVTKQYKLKGDLGEVVNTLGEGIKRSGGKLTVDQVYQKLTAIAGEGGEKSQERKIMQMADLLKGLDALSARFVTRIPVGKLRLGFSEKTILDALSWMETGGKTKKAKLDAAFQVLPDIGLLAKKVKETGIDQAVKKVTPQVGVPVLPMLGQRIKSPTEMIAKMGEVFVEPKFDGLRVLIHFKRPGFVRAFTRNLNNVVEMFPELDKIGSCLVAREVILDTEAVGMDPAMIKMADFQTTMQRRRKYDIGTKSKSIPIRFQVFDIILKNGVNLMGKPYYQRRQILTETIKNNQLLVVDEAIPTQDPEVIIAQYRQKISQGLEGIFIKKADAPYVPGRTGWRWVKMKQEEKALGKLTDTIDGVVMGYTVGKGKRAAFGLGQFLVGVMDGEEDLPAGRQVKTLTKVGTGLTDEEFKSFGKKLEKYKTKEKLKEYQVHKNYTPDFWVTPKFVVELSGDDLTKSPIHTSGYALRFPRLVKFREDRSPSEATTLEEIRRLFKLQ